jgi:hypothetical protein
MTAFQVGSNLDIRTRKLIGLQEGIQWYQTFTLHAVGVGQQDMGLWVPYDSYLVKYRYRVAVAGSGGSMSVDLRLNGTGSGQVISGTSQSVSTTPSWNTPTAPGVSLAADDLLWAYVNTMTHTTVGSQLKVEAILERR